MSPATASWTARRSVLVATILGVTAAILGLVVLVGWYTHTATLIQVLPEFAPMQYNTALGFLLSGIGLVALIHGRARLAVVLGTVLGAIGLVTLVEYVFGVELGIDQLFMQAYITVQSSHPGRMAPNTALSFSLTATALIANALSKHLYRRVWVTAGLGLSILTLGNVAFFGYLFGAQTAYGWGQLTRMSVHTSAGFMTLALGVLAVAFRESPVWVASSGAFTPERLAHERRRIVAVSVIIMAIASMAVGLSVIRELYSTGLDSQRDRLEELVQSQTRMIEAVARFDAQYSQDTPGGARAATLSQVIEAYEQFAGFGETGEFTIATRERDDIVFLVSPPKAGPDFIARVALNGTRAEPMRRAMAGESGTLVGLDYRGELVVAAFAPLPSIGVGLVAKMDLAEIREPFLRSAYLTAGIALIIITIGAGATMLSIGPLTRRVETQAMDLYLTNIDLTHEITERRQAEEALAKNARSLRLTLDAISDGGWEWNIVTGDVLFSDKWLQSLGLEREEVTPTMSFWENLIHPDDMAATMEALKAHLEGRTESYTCENRLRKKTGEYRWNLDRGRVVERDPDGKPLRMVGADTDITELETARAKLWDMNVTLEHLVAARTEQLVAANAELEAFAYSVSHDLKAPLRAIDGFSGMLVERHQTSLSEDAQRLLGVVRSNTKQMARLIDDLLAFSQVGRAEMVVTAVDMRALAEAVFSDLSSLDGNRAVELSMAELPTVPVDLALMRQVWTNLLGNALKFTSATEEARIEVDCEDEPEHYVFRVRDNGAGFDMEYVDKLFGVFQRLHYQEEFPGTGVGLATVKRIVERHGGEVWAEGEVDVGATIFFRLPRSAEMT